MTSTRTPILNQNYINYKTKNSLRDDEGKGEDTTASIALSHDTIPEVTSDKRPCEHEKSASKDMVNDTHIVVDQGDGTVIVFNITDHPEMFPDPRDRVNTTTPMSTADIVTAAVSGVAEDISYESDDTLSSQEEVSSQTSADEFRRMFKDITIPEPTQIRQSVQHAIEQGLWSYVIAAVSYLSEIEDAIIGDTTYTHKPKPIVQPIMNNELPSHTSHSATTNVVIQLSNSQNVKKGSSPTNIKNKNKNNNLKKPDNGGKTSYKQKLANNKNTIQANPSDTSNKKVKTSNSIVNKCEPKSQPIQHKQPLSMQALKEKSIVITNEDTESISEESIPESPIDVKWDVPVDEERITGTVYQLLPQADKPSFRNVGHNNTLYQAELSRAFRQDLDDQVASGKEFHPTSAYFDWVANVRGSLFHQLQDSLPKGGLTPFQTLALNACLQIKGERGLFSLESDSFQKLNKKFTESVTVEGIESRGTKRKLDVPKMVNKQLKQQGLEPDHATSQEKSTARRDVFKKLAEQKKEREDAFIESLTNDYVNKSDAEKVALTVQASLLKNPCNVKHFEKLGTADVYTELRSKQPIQFDWDYNPFSFISRDMHIFSRCTLEQVIMACWFISRKEHNKAMHALNGNTDFSDSDLNLSSSQTSGLTVQADAIMYTNNTFNTIKWKSAMYNCQVLGATLLIPEMFWVALQVVAPGQIPLTLVSSSKINSVHARMWPIKMFTIQSSVTAGLLGTSPVFTDTFLTVPPGYSLYWSVVQTTITSGSVVVMNLGLQNANFRPFGPPETDENTSPGFGEYDQVRLNLWLPGSTKAILTQAKSLEHLRSMILEKYRLSASRYSFTTKVGNKLHIINQGTDVYIKLKMLGGMDNGAIPPEVSGNPIEDATTKENMGASKLSDVATATPLVNVQSEKVPKMPPSYQPLFDLLNQALLGKFDNLFGTTMNDFRSISEAWATTQKPMQTMTNQQASRIYNDWYEGVWATNPGKNLPVGDDHDVFDIILPTYGCSPPTVISTPFSALAQAIVSGETVTMSQYIRINTSLCSGDAMNRAILTSVGKYRSQQTGSTSAVLAKFLLYQASFTPLPGIEQYTIADLHYNFNPNSRTTDTQTTPFAVAHDQPLYARFIDMNTFEALEAGMVQIAFPPVGWQLQDIGTSVAVVPLDYSQLNQPRANAAWSTGWIEYPYVRTSFGAQVNNDHMETWTSDVMLHTNATNTRIPGIYSKVLFVVTNLFPSSNNDMQMLIGDGAGVVALTQGANGLNGVPVDIRPALLSMFNGNGSHTAMSIACETWQKFFGNKEDYYAAHIAAANAHVTLGNLPVRDGFGNMYAYKPAVKPGNTAPSWNTDGYTDLTGDGSIFGQINLGRTHPDNLLVYNDVGWLIAGSNGVRFLGTIDYISATHKMWGFYNYKNPAPSVCYSASGVSARLRFIAKFSTTIFDQIFQDRSSDACVYMTYGQQPDMSQNLGRKTIIDTYRIWKNCFLDSLCPKMTMKMNADNHGQYINGYYDQVNLTALANTGSNIAMSFMRKPLTERISYLDLDNDTSWVMKQYSGTFEVIRTTSILGSQLEVTRTRNDFSHKGLHSAYKQLFSTQWVQGSTPIQPRINLKAYYTNVSTSLSVGLGIRVCHPSTGQAIINSNAQVYGIPWFDTIIYLTDVPTLDMPVSWSNLLNQALFIAFTSPSPYYARFTRQDQTDYFMKIIPDSKSYSTSQLCSSEKESDMLNEFGLDF